MKKRIGILSLGCPRNLVDSEHILGRLKEKGYCVSDMEKADVALVNTCSFIDDAKKESIDAILDLAELKKSGRLKKIIVYGCLTQRYKESLRKELPEVDAFIGRVSLNHASRRFAITPKHYAYLKICEGCVNSCSYCIIPKIKGRFTSLNIESILERVAEFNRQKISELNIIGQDITGYGLDLYGSRKLPELIKRIEEKAKNIGWIRLLYLYPDRVSPELLSLVRSSKKICKYIDLPVQHISERILKLMNRNTTKSSILRLIGKIRKTIPGVALRTSVIVGFPSETDKEFKELLKFITDVKFERLGGFVYSKQEGTPAYNLKGQIPDRIAQERFNQVMALQQKVSEGINKKFLGAVLEVLVDKEENGAYLCRSQYDAPEVDGMVYVNSKRRLLPGDFVMAKITDTLEYDLVGEEINEYRQ